MRYKVKNKECGQALIEYWAMNFHVTVYLMDEGEPHFFTLTLVDGATYPPCWREVNDAFVAGWNRVVQDWLEAEKMG